MVKNNSEQNPLFSSPDANPEMFIMWTMNQNILLLISLLYHHTFKDSHHFSVIYNVLHPAKLGNYSAKSGKEG